MLAASGPCTARIYLLTVTLTELRIFILSRSLVFTHLRIGELLARNLHIAELLDKNDCSTNPGKLRQKRNDAIHWSVRCTVNLPCHTALSRAMTSYSGCDPDVDSAGCSIIQVSMNDDLSQSLFHVTVATGGTSGIETGGITGGAPSNVVEKVEREVFFAAPHDADVGVGGLNGTGSNSLET